MTAPARGIARTAEPREGDRVVDHLGVHAKAEEVAVEGERPRQVVR